MKICAISDMHGNLQDIDIPEADLLVIAGDLIPLSIQSYLKQSYKWFKQKFLPWLQSLPVEQVVFIAGNHDKFLENKSNPDFKDFLDLFSDGKYIYLEDKLYTFTNKKGETCIIYGTPYSDIFGYWSFMESEQTLTKIFSKIPENVDILLTHTAPYGVSDIILQEGFYSGQHIGSTALADAVKEKKPKYVIHGHLHSTNHEPETLGDTTVYNVSVKDESYKVVYKPLVFDL